MNDFFWTLPYKIESKELFLDIDSKLPRKYKKIFEQIKNSYIRKDYSLASVGLTSMIDGLCSYFIYDKGITNRRDLFIPIIEEVEQYTDNNFETVPLIMLNNNINTIYEKVNFGVKIDIAEKGINLCDRIVSKIKNAFYWFRYNLYKVDLKKLTNIEKQIINKFYDDNLNEYTLGHVSIRETDDNYASVLKLIHRKILENQTAIEKIENYDG